MKLTLIKTPFAASTLPPPPPAQLSKRAAWGCLAAVLGLAVLAGHNAVAQNASKYNTPTAATVTRTTITLAWSHPSPIVQNQGAVVQCATSTGPTNCGAPTTIAGSADVGIMPPYTVTGLTVGTTYYFRIMAAPSASALGLIASDVLTVMTTAEPRPTAIAPATISATPGTTVTLTGGGTGESAISNYAWTCSLNSPTGVTGIAAPTLTSGDDATPAATFTAQMLVDASGMPFMHNGAPVTEIVLHCDLVVTNGGGESENMARTVVTIAAASGGGAVDNAVLPNVLRQQTHGIHNGIYQRIQKRQQQDGKWQ